MTLKNISFKNLIRRKGKASFVLAGLVIGVSTVVGIISFVEAMTSDINYSGAANRPGIKCLSGDHRFAA